MPVRVDTQHPDITNNPQTFIAAQYSTGTELIVQNGTIFNPNDYVVVEKYGAAQAEVSQVQSTGSDYIVLYGSLTFPHSVDSPVTRIDYNQYQVFSSPDGVTFTQLGGNQSFTVSQPQYSQVIDPAGTSTFSYRSRYRNTTTGVVSQNSSIVPAGGYPFYSLGSIQQRVLSLFVDNNSEFISLQSITNWCNELQVMANREITGSEQSPFVTDLVFTPGNVESTDLSTLAGGDIESISLVEYSTDGGQTFPNVISPMDSRIKAASPFSQYSYKLEGTLFFIYSANYPSNGTQTGFPVANIVRIWYYSQQGFLVDQVDNLNTLYRSYTPVFVDYCLMRAAEQSRRMSESAAWYTKKLYTGFGPEVPGTYTQMINTINGYINQGNKSIATTWSDSFNNWG